MAAMRTISANTDHAPLDRLSIPSGTMMLREPVKKNSSS
jgi:hypothetical protein